MKKISENLSGDFLTHTVCIATLQVGNANATRTIGAYSSARKSASGWTLSLHEETTLLLMILWSQLLVCKNTITLQWQETIAVQCINACLVLPTHATQLYSHPWGSEHPNIFLWFVRLPWLIAVFRLHNYECVAPLPTGRQQPSQWSFLCQVECFSSESSWQLRESMSICTVFICGRSSLLRLFQTKELTDRRRWKSKSV